MHIEASGLVAALKEAPDERTPPCQAVPEYVMEHIFTPLRRNEPVFFAHLDFEAFTDEDIWSLREWIEQRECLSRRLYELSGFFRNANPVSRPGRAFC